RYTGEDFSQVRKLGSGADHKGYPLRAQCVRYCGRWLAFHVEIEDGRVEGIPLEAGESIRDRVRLNGSHTRRLQRHRDVHGDQYLVFENENRSFKHGKVLACGSARTARGSATWNLRRKTPDHLRRRPGSSPVVDRSMRYYSDYIALEDNSQ